MAIAITVVEESFPGRTPKPKGIGNAALRYVNRHCPMEWDYRNASDIIAKFYCTLDGGEKNQNVLRLLIVV